MPLFINSLTAIAKIWNQVGVQTRWMDYEDVLSICTHTMLYSEAVRNDKIMPFATT